MLRLAGLIALCLAVAGCQTVAHDTPSGRAEVTIAAAAPDKVKSALVNIMINANGRITKDTPSSNYAQPIERISFTLAQVGDATRVVADISFIANPGSAFEQRTAVNNNSDSAKIQEMLDRLKSDIAGP